MRLRADKKPETSEAGRSASASTVRGQVGLPLSRRVSGLAMILGLLPGMTALFVSTGRALSLASMLLLYLLAVVLVAVVGGAALGVTGAVVANLLANWFLTPPYHTLVVDQRDAVISLIVFGLVALLVSVTVEMAARQRVTSERHRVELHVLSRLAAEPMSEATLPAILAEIRAAFGLTTTAVADDGEVVASVGLPSSGPPSVREPLAGTAELWAWGPPMFGADLHLLRAMCAAAARAYEGETLVERAEQAERLESVDQARAALLAAVGHDLRTPIATTKAAVSGLTTARSSLTVQEHSELLATIEASTSRLDDLVSNLLDISRLQAGVLSVQMQPVALDAAVARAVLHAESAKIDVAVPDDLPLAWCDPVLLDRVLANLLDNGVRHAGTSAAVEISAGCREASRLWLCVADHGQGVPVERWPTLFSALQPSADSQPSGRLGLGLAIVRGFVDAMGGTVTPSETPGGGLTMTLSLAVVR